MPSDKRPLVPPRLVFGMVTLLLGVLFLADSADIIRADSAPALWPVGLVAFGLIVVLQPDAANRIVGAVLMIAGVWLLLNNVGIWRYGFWHAWPYLLIVVGAGMLYRVHQMRGRDADVVTGFAFLNRVARQASARFTGGEFSAVGGECGIDLSRATIGEGHTGAIIDAFALFGRIELHVPAGWCVENRVLPLLGRATTMPQPAAATGPTVIVQGSAICGSVSVTASPR